MICLRALIKHFLKEFRLYKRVPPIIYYQKYIMTAHKNARELDAMMKNGIKANLDKITNAF